MSWALPSGASPGWRWRPVRLMAFLAASVVVSSALGVWTVNLAVTLRSYPPSADSWAQQMVDVWTADALADAVFILGSAGAAWGSYALAVRRGPRTSAAAALGLNALVYMASAALFFQSRWQPCVSPCFEGGPGALAGAVAPLFGGLGLVFSAAFPAAVARRRWLEQPAVGG